MSTASPPATVTELIADYARRLGGHDADRIAACHAEDGIFHLHSDAEPGSRPEAIRDTFAGLPRRSSPT